MSVRSISAKILTAAQVSPLLVDSTHSWLYVSLMQFLPHRAINQNLEILFSFFQIRGDKT